MKTIRARKRDVALRELFLHATKFSSMPLKNPTTVHFNHEVRFRGMPPETTHVMYVDLTSPDVIETYGTIAATVVPAEWWPSVFPLLINVQVVYLVESPPAVPSDGWCSLTDILPAHDLHMGEVQMRAALKTWYEEMPTANIRYVMAMKFVEVGGKGFPPILKPTNVLVATAYVQAHLESGYVKDWFDPDVLRSAADYEQEYYADVEQDDA
jgi:hypothetical protein